MQVEKAKKDPAAFGALYEKYYRHIFVFVYRRTGKEELTADLVSQIFVKAMVNIQKYEFKGLPFSSWLFRIAHNEIISFYRKSDRERVVSLEQVNLAAIISEIKEEEKTEDETILLQSIPELDEDAVHLIELRYFEQRPFNEVGEILGITENNAKVKLYRILDKLKEIILKKKKLS